MALLTERIWPIRFRSSDLSRPGVIINGTIPEISHAEAMTSYLYFPESPNLRLHEICGTSAGWIRSHASDWPKKAGWRSILSAKPTFGRAAPVVKRNPSAKRGKSIRAGPHFFAMPATFLRSNLGMTRKREDLS